jgi:hypothetical protein
VIKLLKRSALTAAKLPFSMAWDVISLGNIGDGSSTGKVLREHKDRKLLVDISEVAEYARKLHE